MAYQLPPDIQQRIQVRLETTIGMSADDILRRALDALDSQDREIIAIQEGLDDMQNGNVRPLREFDKEFRTKKNIPLDA